MTLLLRLLFFSFGKCCANCAFALPLLSFVCRGDPGGIQAQVVEARRGHAPDFSESRKGCSGHRQGHPFKVPDPGGTGHPGVIE